MRRLHLIRVPIALGELARWAGERGWLRGRRRVTAFDEGRALHHLVDETFGPGVLRPFRLLVPPRGRAGNLYAYSALDQDQLRRAMRSYALPDHAEVVREDRLASKAMPDDWREGRRVGFDVRVRPVRRLRADLETPAGRFRSGAELDAFLLEALRQHPSCPHGMSDQRRAREVVYLDWLAERLAPAAELEREDCSLVRFHRTHVARGDQGLDGPDATIHGSLIVTSEAGFYELLARGVGRHRAYGYGMLLLRPPGSAPPIR